MTTDQDMLAAIAASTSPKTHHLVVKCAATANTAGANIIVKNIPTKVRLPPLQAFVEEKLQTQTQQGRT